MKHVLAALAFYARHPGWHSYAPLWRKQIASLERLGFLEVSHETKKARFTGKVFASK